MSLSKIFKSGNEMYKLAHVLNTMVIQVRELVQEVKTSSNPIEDCMESLYVLMYHSKILIMDKIEEYKWPLSNKMIIPAVDRKRITIGYALQHSVFRLHLLAHELGLTEEIQEIIDPLFKKVFVLPYISYTTYILRNL